MGLTVTATGTTGTTAYSYRVSAFNAQGETLACTAVAITDGNATLSSTNYNALAWTAVAGAEGYNVWGRTATGYGEVYLATVVTNAYNDQGAATPIVSQLPPEGNTTAGIKGKFACFAINRIFVAGDSANPSRLYWGGVADQIDNFSWGIGGGGAIDVNKNDGAEIRAIVPFQGGVIVGKDNAIYKFSFASDGTAQLEEITRSFGMISHYAAVSVENDLIFPAQKDGRLAFYSLGNQENYAASILRTNELSIKIAAELENVNLAYIDKSDAFYFRNIYGCAVPTAGQTSNNRVWCLDTRFGAWTYWTDLDPSTFATFRETSASEELYYGSNTDGYMYKMFQDDRNDNGSAISVAFATKAFDQDSFHKIKKYFRPTFQFKNVSGTGSLTGQIIIDGLIVEEEFNVSTLTSGGLGFGAFLFGDPLFGDATGGTPETIESADQLVELYTKFEGRSIKYRFESNIYNLKYKLLSIEHDFIVLNKRLASSLRLYT